MGLESIYKGIGVLATLVLLSIMLFMYGCGQDSKGEGSIPREAREVKLMRVYSNSFSNGGRIPNGYTCEGSDISPHISWSDEPAGTKSFVLIVSDPDAPIGTFYHWVLYDIPKDVKEIPENASVRDLKEKGIKVGMNDFRREGYGGPCPPPGKPHRYFFTVYALDVETIGLPPGADARRVLETIRGHVIAEGEIYGTYSRK